MMHTGVGLSLANPGNSAMYKPGPVPSETPFQRLFGKLHLYYAQYQYHLNKLNTNIGSYMLSS